MQAWLVVSVAGLAKLDLASKEEKLLPTKKGPARRNKNNISYARAAMMTLLAVRSSLLAASSQEASRKPSAAKGLGLPSAGGTTLAG